MRLPIALGLLAISTLAAAPVPKDFKKKSDLDALQGEWVIGESVMFGKPSPASHGIRYAVTGNAIRLFRPDGTTDGTITLDEKEKTYTWDAAWGTWVGRYRIDGDKLTMVGWRGQVPPDELKPGPRVEYDVLSRAK